MKKVLSCIAVILLCAGSLRASDRNAATHPASAKITPCAPGVVYIQLKTGSHVIESMRTKGSSPQSTGSITFDLVARKLRMLEIVPFDAAAPKDSITHALGIDRIYSFYYSDLSVDPHTALAMLEQSGEVDCGSVRYLFPVLSKPNDPLLSQQYALTNMQVYSAWDVTHGDTSIVIADVDCAINIDHDDLKNQVKLNWGEVGLDANGHDKRTNGIDDDGDGYVDNWNGWDVVGGANASNGERFEPDNDPRPDASTASHGTFTAGNILAQGNNSKGIAGVAYGCKLMPIKAAGSDDNNIAGGYEGIHYASTHGARVINCSWGGGVSGSDMSLSNIFLLEATARGALVVAAAGNVGTNNDNTPFYPSNGPGVLSVGASDQNDAAAYFSNFGNTVSCWAPGVGITSTAYPGNSAYGAEDGTSFSSPLTAGVASLVFSVHPNWTPAAVAKQIVETCDNVVNPSDRTHYWGRVNAMNAVGTPMAGPGLVVTGYELDGVANDSLGAPGTAHTLKVDFQNVLGVATGVNAQLVSSAGYSTTSSIVNLGLLSLNLSASATFQITRNTDYSEGLVPVKIVVSNASSDDSLTIYIPLKKIAGFSYDRLGLSGSSVKRVSNNVAWAVFGDTKQNGTIPYSLQSSGSWSMISNLGSTDDGIYDLEALDAQTAWFGTGGSNVATVVVTHDGGVTTNAVDVSNYTPFVNTIHFFDAQNGIIIGDPHNSYWGICTTTNGGTTWSPLAKRIAATGTIASWNNSASWVGNFGWFGTNGQKIFRTTDRGTTWKSYSTPNMQHSLSVAFADDAQHGMACFRPAASSGGSSTSGSNAIGVTSDSGLTWKSITLPVAGISPGSVWYVPNSTIAVVTSNAGVFKSSDNGATWTKIPIPASYVADGAAVSISRDASEFVVTINSDGSGVASYHEAMQAAPPKPDPVTATPTSVDFGTQDVGVSNSQNVSIVNANTMAVTISSVTKNPVNGPFTITPVPLPKTLQPGDTLTLQLTFLPTTSGNQSADIAVTLAEGLTTHIMLSGAGKAQSGVDDGSSSVRYDLQVAANPVRGSTRLHYELPQYQVVHVSVFDALGREVAVLANGAEFAGGHDVTFDARTLAPGGYYVSLIAEYGVRLTRTITLLP